MRFNLSTKINAYPKVSPSALINYVTEAPIDHNLYGRQNREWVEIKECEIRNTKLYYGNSSKSVLTSFSDIEEISTTPKEFSKDSVNEIIINNYVLPQVNYFWVCCSSKVANIFCFDDSLTVGCIYTNRNSKKSIAGDDGLTYYCYRLESHLIKDHPWNFRIVLA